MMSFPPNLLFVIAGNQVGELQLVIKDGKTLEKILNVYLYLQKSTLNRIVIYPETGTLGSRTSEPHYNRF